MRSIPFGKPLLGAEEKDAVMEVLSGTTLVHGPKAVQFEQDFAAFCGAPHAVSVSSCTAGLHLLYFHLGIGPGDEVIVPAQTHVATAHAVELCGAKPVFADADSSTGNIDIDKLEGLITEQTRAISVVHFLGLPVNMTRVMEIARRHKLFVVEDCALAIGSYHQGVHAGLIGDAGCFSFYPVKHMTTAEGGMIILRDGDLAKSLRLKKAFGVDRTHTERTVPGLYDVVELGFNYRLSEVHAAIGIEQIKKVPDFLSKRKANAARLRAALADLPGISLLAEAAPGDVHSHYCESILLDEALVPRRYDIVEALKAQGVGTSVYYPRPVPLMRYYREKYPPVQDWPQARRISEASLALPVGPHLEAEDIDYLAQTLRSVIGQFH